MEVVKYISGNFYIEDEYLSAKLEDIEKYYKIKFNLKIDNEYINILLKDIYKPIIFIWKDFLELINRCILIVDKKQIGIICICILRCLKNVRWNSQLERINSFYFLRSCLDIYIEQQLANFDRKVCLKKFPIGKDNNDTCYQFCANALKKYNDCTIDIHKIIDIGCELYSSKIKPDSITIIEALITFINNHPIISDIQKYDIIHFTKSNLSHILSKLPNNNSWFNC